MPRPGEKRRIKGKRLQWSMRAQERRIRAWELRKAGASTRAIGREIGVTHKSVEKMLARTTKELEAREQGAAMESKALDLARIDDHLLRLQPLLNRTDKELARLTPEPRARLMLEAMQKASHLLEMRAKIIPGYLAPSEQGITIKKAEPQTEEELRAAIAAVLAGSAEPGPG